ncbi:MAG: hypothetical protein PHC62_03880 [Candidatus Izemoplasmatales bacterium]|nr:hypothetical protein [Candidatus Izemoplasmatales bacterium]
MPVPKSVTKIKKGNVEYISNVDRVNYTINELTRAALRDTGKFVCNKFRSKFYALFKKRSGRVGKYSQYWVRKKDADLQVGIKPNAFYGGFQEKGTKSTKKQGLLQKSVEENIPKIIEIQSRYLSALENEAKALSLIDESEQEGE